MVTKEQLDEFFSMADALKGVPFHELIYHFDTKHLNTSIDANQASYLRILHLFSVMILEAIIDLYNFDVTGCIDSELL